MENLEKITGHCFYNGQRQYQRFMDDEEKKINEGRNAFCLLDDNKCPYNFIKRDKNYCKANEKEVTK